MSTTTSSFPDDVTSDPALDVTSYPPFNVTDVNATSNVTLPMTSSGSRYIYSLPPVELHYYHVIYLSVAIALGVPGNALVVAAYSCLKKKSSCDWYILYIAVLDLIICLFRVPTHLAMETGHWQKRGTDALCKFVYLLSQSVITASVILFGFIAIDRYIKVCQHTIRIDARFSKKCILGISALSLVSALPSLWMFGNNAAGKCVTVSTLLGLGMMRIYYTFIFAVFIAMLVVVIFCYTFIIIKVKKSQLILRGHQRLKDTQSVVSYASRDTLSVKRPRTNKVAPSSSPGKDSGVFETCSTARTNLFETGNKVAAAAAGYASLPEPLESEIYEEVTAQLRNPKSTGDFRAVRGGPDGVRLITIKPLGGSTSRLLPRAPTTGSPRITSFNNGSSSRKHNNSETSGKAGREVLLTASGHAEHEDGIYNLGFSVDKISLESDPSRGLSDDESLVKNNAEELAKARGPLEEGTSQAWGNGNKEAPDLTLRATSLPEMNERFLNTRSQQGKTEQTQRELKDHAENQNRANREGKTQTLNPVTKRVNELRKPSSSEIYNISYNSSNNNNTRTGNDNSSNNNNNTRTGNSSKDETSSSANTGVATAVNKMATAGGPSVQHTLRTFRLTLLLLLVTIVFVISWIPPYVAMVWYFYVGYDPPLSSSDIALQMYAPSGYVLNHFANPILYLAFSSAFRETVVAMWKFVVRKLTQSN